MSKQFYNPEPFASAGRPYAAAVRAANMIFLSGQLGVSFDTGERQVVAPGDAVGQLEQIFANMARILDGMNAALQDICWIQIFVTDMSDRLRMDAVRRRHFPDSPGPAATMIQVNDLALPGAVVEVNAIAALD